MIRGIVQSVIEGMVKRIACSGRSDETITNREYFQHYGFTSRPLAGAEAILIQEGNHIIMIGSDDRRYRIAIEAGEVCVYTDEGDHIRFKRGKEIYVKSGNKLVGEIENEVTITTKNAVLTCETSEVTASASAQVSAPQVTITGSESCRIASPQLGLGGGWEDMKRLIHEEFKDLFDNHVHSGITPGGGLTGKPTEELVLDDYSTTQARGT